MSKKDNAVWTFQIKDKHNGKDDFYSFIVYEKKKWNKLWLLLLLLPLCLLVQCHKQIDAVCIEPQTGIEIEDMKVEMTYNAYLIYHDGQFSLKRAIECAERTDSAGVAHFTDLPCSVFSYIFCCMSQAFFSAKSECYMASDQACNFHYTKSVKLDMEPRRENLYIKVVDRETGDLLPDSRVIYRFTDGNDVLTDSSITDAGGVATLRGLRFCSVIELIQAAQYGYADTIATNMPANSLLDSSDSTALRLRPIKERFTFFVKDKETRQPIANALAKVTLTHPNGTAKTSNLHTSIDGKGVAVYDNAFILSVIAIHASKLHYKDGDLEGGPWTVDKFRTQPDDVRTVWLEPEPYVVEFMNVDSITGSPIPNVHNRIKVTDPAGNTETFEETSNRNGVFPVKAKEGSVIEIISDNAVGYKDKATRIPKFSTPEKIKMEPEMVKIDFRTIDVFNSRILPGCGLAITGSMSGSLKPNNSGTGSFTVEARYVESLSITASKNGYITNSHTIRNTPVSQLEVAPQSSRDIPLELDLPPCNGGQNVPKGKSENYHQRSYAMGKMSGVTYIDVDFYDWADFLTVYDGASASGTPVVPRMSIANKRSVPVQFSHGAITVVIESSEGGSSWEYEVRCPN